MQFAATWSFDFNIKIISASDDENLQCIKKKGNINERYWLQWPSCQTASACGDGIHQILKRGKIFAIIISASDDKMLELASDHFNQITSASDDEIHENLEQENSKFPNKKKSSVLLMIKPR